LNMLRKLLILNFFLILIGSLPVRSVSSDCSYCCKRIAVLDEFVNKHNPDFDEKQAEWAKCIDSQIKGMETFDPDNPRFKQAIENCKHLEPDSWEYMYPISVLSIQTWVTEREHKDPIPAHYSMMFTNPDAKTRKDRPINELLWDFEKTPVSCQIKPEKDVVEPDEQISIELTGFKDRKGRNSREFNRIVVQALEGEILNGEKSTFDPELRVFTVSNRSVTVLYKAPESGEITEDMIYTYNSCDILDTESLPLSETEIKDKIAERKIKIESGGDWTGTIIYKRNISWTNTLPIPTGGTVTYKRELKEDATVRVTLKYTHSYQAEDYFDEVTITGNYNLSVRMEDIISHTDQPETRSVKTAQGSGSLGLMSGEGDGGASVMLVIDNKAKTYSLHCDIDSPFCVGTEVISGAGGPAKFPFEWGFAADGVIFEGSTAGKTVSGSLSTPVSGNVMLSQYSGKGQGTSWIWNFTKTGD